MCMQIVVTKDERRIKGFHGVVQSVGKRCPESRILIRPRHRPIQPVCGGGGGVPPLRLYNRIWPRYRAARGCFRLWNGAGHRIRKCPSPNTMSGCCFTTSAEFIMIMKCG